MEIPCKTCDTSQNFRPKTATMTAFIKSSLATLGVVVLSIALFAPREASATALTYKVEANERACFYAWVDKVGEKVAFYFAVLPSPISLPSIMHTHTYIYIHLIHEASGLRAGPSRRLLRYRLRSQGSATESYPGRDKRTTRRFRIYSTAIRRILILFFKRHVYICRKSRRF